MFGFVGVTFDVCHGGTVGMFKRGDKIQLVMPRMMLSQERVQSDDTYVFMIRRGGGHGGKGV